MRVDEDADHDRVADGADHDGADAGAGARLVDAGRVGDRLVVGSEDVLRCVSYGLYDSAVMTEGDREGPDALGGGDELDPRVGGSGEARVDVEVGLYLSEVYHNSVSVCALCSRPNQRGRRLEAPGTFRAPASRHPTCMLPECTPGDTNTWTRTDRGWSEYCHDCTLTATTSSRRSK